MKNKLVKKTLKNGLSVEQVDNARSILKQVNVAEICKSKKVKVSTIYNVLRDESPHVDLLKIVLDEANKIIDKRSKVLKAIPA